MTLTNPRWTIALGAALGLFVATAGAQDEAWRPGVKPAPAVAAPAGPVASIGRPVGDDDDPAPLDLTRVSHAEPIPDSWTPEGGILRTQGGGAPPPPPPDGGVPPVPIYHTDPSANTYVPLNNNAPWGTTPGWAGHYGKFQSDHCFDNMISPVSNPFFFEDPRALTEVRPIFIYQTAPHGTLGSNGGNAEFFGVQGRLAVTDCWSVVINKLGFVALNPSGEHGDYQPGTGFAEFDIGPKWTFLRSESTGSVVATGLTFQIPTATKAAQDTGTLGVVPYISYAQTFGKLPKGYGSFNFLTELGYDFSVNNQRAEYFQASFHLDYDVGNVHKFYPLIELNWFHQTKRGEKRDLTFEGADLVNFGATDPADRDLVTMALGARYKFKEWFQVGSTFEFPLTSYKGIDEFRWTLDFIFRY
jgi:hypothetical protein